MKFIMSLREAHDTFDKELKIALGHPMPEYYRFLKALGFYAFIEQVILACSMYPRSIDMCRDNLDDLKFAIYDNLGIGKFYLSHLDRERLGELVEKAGREVMLELESHRYYFESNQFPRGWEKDPNFESDLTAITDVKKISSFTFMVEINEHHFDDDFDVPQNAISFPKLNNRSY